MVSERQLNLMRDAFNGLAQSHNLNGWGLDPMGWYYNGNQETDDADLHLLRGQTERVAITVLPGPGATVENLQPQVLSQMLAKGLISPEDN